MLNSLIIPAYNEADVIYQTVAQAMNLPHMEVIVVDDGSTDDTSYLLKDLPLTYLRNPTNMGKGYSVRAGVEAASGDFIFYTDADLSYSLANIAVAEKLLLLGADLVCGKRYGDYPMLRRSSSAVYNYMAQRVLGLEVSDVQCGFKGFRAEAAKQIFSASCMDGFSFDSEILYMAKEQRYTTIEMSVKLTHKKKTSVHLLDDGLSMFADLFKIRRIHSRKMIANEG